MTDILAAIDAATGCQHCGGPLGDSPSDDFCRQGCAEAWHAARAERLVGYREPWNRPEDFPGVGTEAMVVGEESDPMAGEMTGHPTGILRHMLADAEFTIADNPHVFMRPPIRPGAARRVLAIGNPDPPTWRLADRVRVFVGAPGELAGGHWFEVGRVGEQRDGHEPAMVIVDEVYAWSQPEFRLPRSTSNLTADLLAATRAAGAARTPAQHAAVALRMESIRERQEERRRRQEEQIAAAFNVAAEWLRPAFEDLGLALAGIRWPLFRRGHLGEWAQERPEPEREMTPRERALHLRRTRNTGPPLRPLGRR